MFFPDGIGWPHGPINLRASLVVANFNAIADAYICIFVCHDFVISEVKRIQQHTPGAFFELLVLV